MNILCPIPNKDFDPTEVSVPWSALVQAGHTVTFATPNGEVGEADFRMVTGEGLGIFKSTLMADKFSQAAYSNCIKSKEFNNPISYEDINADDYDSLFLPGGHAKGMRDYLESKKIQDVTVAFFKRNAPVAAICHGTLAAARSINPETGKSVLFGRKTTGLTFTQELIAWLLTFLWLGDYYRTYPKFMQHDLQSYLESPKDYEAGPTPLFRDSPDNIKAGFIVKDENYLSARWPGDIHLFSQEFLKMLY